MTRVVYDYSPWLRALQQAQTPDMFEFKVKALERERGDYVLTDRGSLFREAFCAAEFSKLVGAAKVRLIPEHRPDFEIECRAVWHPYEVTEADRPGRRRDEEYRSDRCLPAGTVKDLPVEECLNPEMAANILAAACAKKLAKRYNPNVGLVIWLNPPSFGWDHEEITAVLVPSTASAGEYFKEVWVFWERQLHKTWSDHLPSGSVITKPDIAL